MRYELFLNFCDGSPGGEWTKLKSQETYQLPDGSLHVTRRTGAVSTLPASDRYASGDPKPGQWRERLPIESAAPVFEPGATE